MQTTSASRSPLGKVPYALTLLTAAFVPFACFHSQDGLWPPLEVIVALPVFAVLLAECVVRWQLRLVNNGQVVEAIVGEVRRPSWWTRTDARAFYHYATKDGQVINSSLKLSKMEVDQWSPGRSISVIYDPAKPARHQYVEALWAVEWEIVREE